MKYSHLILAGLLLMASSAYAERDRESMAMQMAQSETVSIKGKVVSDNGEAIPGAAVYVKGTTNQTVTDSEGNFAFSASNDATIVVQFIGYKNEEIAVNGQSNLGTITLIALSDKSGEVAEIGYSKSLSLDETTASISIISKEEISQRNARNIANALYGQGLGLTTLQNSGRYSDCTPTFYIRGLKTLTDYSSTPLLLVDGIERDIDDISPEEVENVTVLKDAAAVALYGYKGTNGVINVVTKRGTYEESHVKVEYSHAFEYQPRRPEFANALTYAKAMNEALINDGGSEKYNEYELAAFESGEYPYYYPDVDWIEETFRDWGQTNDYSISFYGGSKMFRYYTLAKLNANKGFVKNYDSNPDYSTQEMFSRGSLRTNLDIDLTGSTKLKLNLLGVLNESKYPCTLTTLSKQTVTTVDLWDCIYQLPAAAFPIQQENGLWGGTATWDGTLNPVALSQDAGYLKYHKRSLFTDVTLTQDFSVFVKGLSAEVRVAYDNAATYTEDHTRTYEYASYTVSSWNDDGTPDVDNLTEYTGGSESSLGSTTVVTAYDRVFNVAATAFYEREFNENNKLYAQLRWDYEYRNTRGIDATEYHQDASLFLHYGLKNRYFADFSLVASGFNRFAPDHKWAMSPTLSLAWIATQDLGSNDILNFLKFRISGGIINSDNYATTDYWEQTYGGGSYYSIDSAYSGVSTGSWALGQLATGDNSTHEKAAKFNFGIDAQLLGGLDVNIEAFYEHRYDIWVSTDGKYSSILGFTAPYENGGIVNSYGVEIGLDYTKSFGDITVNVGGKFTYNGNEIKEQYEELQAWDNLTTTGKRVGQIFGLKSIGFFKDQDDIDSSTTQNFGTLYPGDIKYEDVNGDGQIDTDDYTAIGYNTIAPEIYYSFHVGAEWKGLGFNALFQGTGRYSAMLTTQSVYWPLIDDTTISNEYYENRWTSETADSAKYPRLTAQDNTNNFQYNTTWLEDRSFLKLRTVELYYKFPQSLLSKTKIMNEAKIYVRGHDLACFDKIEIADPEAYGVGYPTSSSIVAGLSIEF